jgi:hypothetical protein
MPNESNVVAFPRLDTQASQAYIDGMGMMWAGMGGNPTAGRVLGYLMLMPAPVSLDRMVSDLGAAKSSLSVAANQLVQTGMARRLPTRGSRRVLFEAADSFESLVEVDNQRRAMFLEKIRQGEAIVPPGRAADRFRAFAELMEFSIDRTREMLQRWRASRPPGSPGR